MSTAPPPPPAPEHEPPGREREPDGSEPLPLLRELPRGADPGEAGRRRIAQLSQIVGFAWMGFWFFLAPSGGSARFVVGAAGGMAVVVARYWLHTHGSKLLDASHLGLELASPAVRRGGRVEATVAVRDPGRVRGAIDVALECVEFYAYRSDSDNAGPRRRTGRRTLFKFPQVIQSAAGQTVAFPVPVEAPFSYEGDYVRYVWALRATERVERGLDPVVELPVRVLP